MDEKNFKTFWPSLFRTFFPFMVVRYVLTSLKLERYKNLNFQKPYTSNNYFTPLYCLKLRKFYLFFYAESRRGRGDMLCCPWTIHTSRAQLKSHWNSHKIFIFTISSVPWSSYTWSCDLQKVHKKTNEGHFQSIFGKF